MRIGITGGTGFLGRYIVRQLTEAGHSCRCWHRPTSDLSNLHGRLIEWIPGELGDAASANSLVEHCDAVVHAALDRPGAGFRGAEGELLDFVRKNVLGTIQLIEAARAAKVPKFIFISTCAVHEKILEDRPLDETHPTWALSHYGAHKAALESFVHSYGYGQGYPICALRPTGIYGLAHPPRQSKWFDLVRKVVTGEEVECQGGGKEVHAADVARAVQILLDADGIAGESYNCYDMYISQFDVGVIAREKSGSSGVIRGLTTAPKHQIETGKLRALGMVFGGRHLLEETVEQLVSAVKASAR